MPPRPYRKEPPGVEAVFAPVECNLLLRRVGKGYMEHASMWRIRIKEPTHDRPFPPQVFPIPSPVETAHGIACRGGAGSHLVLSQNRPAASDDDSGHSGDGVNFGGFFHSKSF